jgi:hypothetical protein
MKNLLTALLLLLSCSAFSQVSYLKAGANLGFNFMLSSDRPYSGNTYPVAPGLNLSYEKPWGSRTSFVMDLNATHNTSYWYFDWLKSQNEIYQQ